MNSNSVVWSMHTGRTFTLRVLALKIWTNVCVLYQLCWELSWIFKRFIKILGSLNVVVMLESELFTVTSTPSVFTSEVKEQVCWVTFLSPKAHLKKKLYLFI